MRDAPTDSDEPANDRRLLAHLALLVMAIIWAVNFSVAKVALRHLSPLAFNTLRFPLAALTLLIVLRLRRGVLWPERKDVGRIVLLGVTGNLLYQQFFIFGLDHSRAGTASLLLAGTPLLTALLSAAVGHEKVKPRVWFGVSCTVVGIALVVLSREPLGGAEPSIWGPVLLLGASVIWAFYTVGSKGLVARYGPLPVTAWTLWIGTALIVVIGLPDALRVDLGSLSLGSWLAVAYAGVLSIGIAYLIWYYGVEQLGNTRTATYSNLVPAIALAVAWLWLSEIPTIGQVAGAVIIIGGVTLAQSS